MQVSLRHDSWNEIVQYGLENQQIDFKAAQNWNDLDKHGKAKFARHAMALANTLGGYIVVGVGEDASGKPTLYTGMTESQTNSFDPSTVGQTINRYADPGINFDLVKTQVDGKTYVIFVVYPFANIPHVCVDSYDNELQRGVFYIRTPDASSRAAIKSSEVHAIIQRALRNQRQLLGRMLRGILYEDRQGTEPSAEKEFADLVQSAEENAFTFFSQYLWKESVFCIITIHLQKLNENTSLTEWRQQLLELERPGLANFPWPHTPKEKPEVFAGNHSLRCQSTLPDRSGSFYLEVFASGLFYAAVPLSFGRKKEIPLESLLLLPLMTIALNGELFTQMKLGSELLSLTFTLKNSENASVVTSDGKHRFQCRIPEICVRKSRSAGDLEGGAASNTAAKFFREICERFNLSLTDQEFQETTANLEHTLRQGMLKETAE